MKRYVIFFTLALVPLVLYFPFRLVAARTNTTVLGYFETNGGIVSGGFAYPWATALWPSYAFLAGCIPFLIASLLGLSWKTKLTLFPLVVFVSYAVANLDSIAGFSDSGDTGLLSWELSPDGWNTTLLSVVACPIAITIGALVGTLLARRFGRQD